MLKKEYLHFLKNVNQIGKINNVKNKKNILIIIFIALGMYFVLSFNDHNFKRAVDACLAGSQKLSESKITDLEKLENFVKIK